MAVTAAATWTIVSGSFSSLPVTVQFDSTSSGSPAPDFFMYDFGDGFGSDEENPIHIYTTAGPHTVTLTVLEKDGAEFQATTSVADPFLRRQGSAFVNHQDAYDDFNSISFTENPGSGGGDKYHVEKSLGTFKYLAVKNTRSFNLTPWSESTHIVYLQRRSDNTATFLTAEGSVNVLLNGSSGLTFVATADFPTWYFLKNISDLINTFPTIEQEDAGNYQILTEPSSTVFVGWQTTILAFVQAFNAKDETTLIVGPTTADFDVSASSGLITPAQVSGISPLSVNLRNLSIRPEGSTYIWEMREFGTTGAWIEIFTDEEPPSRDFDKTDPLTP